MEKYRSRQQRNEGGKLMNFPDDFCDVFFHNEMIEADKKIPHLRYVVYRKIKDSIIERVSSSRDLKQQPLKDSFDVTFETSGYSEFQWAVIREELMDVGFDAEFSFNDDTIDKLIVTVKREISLKGKRDHESGEYEEEIDSEEETTDSEEPSEESVDV